LINKFNDIEKRGPEAVVGHKIHELFNKDYLKSRLEFDFKN
jgi:hypothetical protein